jgi:hypothetical protein
MMKNNKKKLSLRKEKIASLTNQDMSKIKGGRKKTRQLGVCEASDQSYRSTNAGFTCCMCTGGQQ